jgi:hypothetical protein
LKNFLKLLFCCLIWQSSISFAQVNCIKSDSTTGCAPFTAKINYCGPLQDNGLPFPSIYQFGNSQTTSSTTHTFTNAGLYNVTQKVAYQTGKPTYDSVFTNFFRVVSTPNFNIKASSCKDKSVSLIVDSTSYDYYIITNSLNNDRDSIKSKFNLIKSFQSFGANEVEFTITGKYFLANCQTIQTIKTELIDKITPKSISEVSEFKSTSIKLEPIPNINHIVKWLLSSVIQDSKTFSDQNSYSFNQTKSYDQIQLTVLDQCNNEDPILDLPTFTSLTTFQNNQNTITHTSPSFIPKSSTFLKIKTDTLMLSSNIDDQIVCGSTDCYAISSNETFGVYNFKRISSGNCGTSFSVDKPVVNTIDIDNSGIATIVRLDTENAIEKATINTIVYTPNSSNEVSIPKTLECISITLTNKCNKNTDLQSICPLILKKSNQNLEWNTTTNKTYSLYWTNDNGDTTLVKSTTTSPYFLDPKNYFAQNFCIYVQEENTEKRSNSICYEDYPLLFIPELVYTTNNKTINLKTKYIENFKFQIHDSNGNEVKIWDQNSILSVENLDKGTYFYIFEGISEKGDKILSQGSIIIKD